MIKFEQLNAGEQDTIRQTAMKYFQHQKKSIYSKIKPETPKVAPLGSVMYSPESWKADNWKWFLDNSFLL